MQDKNLFYNVALYFAESFAITNKDIEAIYSEVESDEDRAKLKKFGLIKNAYESKAYRPLTFAERKVNFTSIENSFDIFDKAIMEELKQAVETEKQRVLPFIKKAIEENNPEKIQQLKTEFDGVISRKVAKVQKELFEIGKKTASDEMGVLVPKTEGDISGLYRGQAMQIEQKISNEMDNLIQEEFYHQYSRGVSGEIIVSMIEKALDLKIQKMINAVGTQAVTGAFNTGRLAVFEMNKEKVYAFQYTAVLDNRTTNLCKSLNGRVVGRDDPDFFRLAPPNHINCRSIWVEILQDEIFKPKIGKIPESIPRNTGYTTFQDLKKVIPIGKLEADPTLAELNKARDGVLNNVRVTLQRQGVKFKKPIPDPQVSTGGFKSAGTIQEAEKYATKFFESQPNYGKLTLDEANKMNKLLEDTFKYEHMKDTKIKEFGVNNRMTALGRMFYSRSNSENMKLEININGIRKMEQGTQIKKNAKKLKDLEDRLAEFTKAGKDPKILTAFENEIAKVKNFSDIWTIADKVGIDKFDAVVIHELGHAIDNGLKYKASLEAIERRGQPGVGPAFQKAEKFHEIMRSFQIQNIKGKNILSEYGKTSNAETVAESYAAYYLKQFDRISQDVKDLFDSL